MDIKPLRIAHLTIDPPLVLAPMAGYTRAPFRAICLRLGCQLVFTEVITAEGIIRRDRKTMGYLETFPEEHPIGAHVYGSDPDSLAGAARVIESLGRFDLVDLNCGCPVPKVTRRGAGVALMEDPDRLGQIVQAMVEATSLPVTIKTRLGLSPDRFNISEVAQAAEEGGASALTIHARFASQKHAGPVDLAALRRIKAERTMPIVGNGGIVAPHHAVEMIRQTGVDGVMIGRGAIGTPWLFAAIAHLWSGVPYTPPSDEDRRRLIGEHLRKLHELQVAQNRIHRHRKYTPEQIACRRFRNHLARYLAGRPGARRWRARIMALDSIETVLATVDEILAE